MMTVRLFFVMMIAGRLAAGHKSRAPGGSFVATSGFAEQRQI